MADKLVSVNDDFDFPAPVAARQAARLGDATTAEGKVLAGTVATSMEAAASVQRGLAVPDVLDGYLFVTNSASGKRRQVTGMNEALTGEPETMGEGVVATIDGKRKWVSPSGYPRPIATNFAQASGWGSSTMQRLGPDLATMLTKRGTTYHHSTGSVGGYQISHIAAAVGVRPLLTDAFTIPAAATAAPITPTNMPEMNNTQISATWAGEFAGTGVAGTVRTAANSDAWTFTRTTAGTAVNVPAGTPFIPKSSTEFQAGVTILNPGKNTLTSPRGEWNVDRVIELTDEMYDFFSGAGRHVLVLGHFVDSGKPADTYERPTIRKFNDHMRTRYGARFIDISAYLTGAQVWKDTGITPNAADLEQQALGNKPLSLSDDNLHLNQRTDEAITQLIEAKLSALGWLNIAPPTRPLTTIADDFNRADGPLGVTSVGVAPWRLIRSSDVMPSIAGNRMVNPDSYLKRAVVTAPSNATDYEVSARIAGLGQTAANKNMSILLRVVDADNYLYLTVRQHSSGEGAALWHRKAGSPQIIGTANTTVLSAVGQVWKAQVQGNTLKAYVDGVEVLSVTDAAIPAAGDAGLLLGGETSTACAWDDFNVTKL